ncbi:hypothetical protein BDN71DRAFT_516230 [Pleurotus eryngii]|uniref:Uncharacterized protein n=1 Tax=Pleurotus eryngii TaxID=5323 RepID=A0A9P6D9D2_PLEER|nr:hypothetical protein BDN71DRAFT_516230 [Pleurotus eryngii]
MSFMLFVKHRVNHGVVAVDIPVVVCIPPLFLFVPPIPSYTTQALPFCCSVVVLAIFPGCSEFIM